VRSGRNEHFEPVGASRIRATSQCEIGDITTVDRRFRAIVELAISLIELVRGKGSVAERPP
jgi:hypothetical protein